MEAANREALRSPKAKSNAEYSPVRGKRAGAASFAVSILIPWAKMVAALGEYDKIRYDIGDQTAEIDIPFDVPVIGDLDSFFYDCGLQVKLHPGGDGRPHDPYYHVDISRLQAQAGSDRLGEKELPVGLQHQAGYDVGDVDRAGNQKYLLQRSAVAHDHDRPDQDRSQWN